MVNGLVERGFLDGLKKLLGHTWNEVEPIMNDILESGIN